MTNGDELHPVLHTALNLDGSADSIKNFYAGWAENYNNDTLNWNYAAPANALYLLENLPASDRITVNPESPDFTILDAGCGTGLLAKALQGAGYRNIDGFDISPDMVEIARDLNIYRNLEGNVDINATVGNERSKKYDCTISIGVFTLGHVPPQALGQLVKMTRKGGVVIVSTRIAYFDSENFLGISQELEENGVVQLVTSLKNAAYTDDEQAHYWVYAVQE